MFLPAAPCPGMRKATARAARNGRSWNSISATSRTLRSRLMPRHPPRRRLRNLRRKNKARKYPSSLFLRPIHYHSVPLLWLLNFFYGSFYSGHAGRSDLLADPIPLGQTCSNQGHCVRHREQQFLFDYTDGRICLDHIREAQLYTAAFLSESDAAPGRTRRSGADTKNQNQKRKTVRAARQAGFHRHQTGRKLPVEAATGALQSGGGDAGENASGRP